MSKTFEITGMEKFMKNFAKEVEKIEGASMAGLLKAVIIVRRDMDKTEPKIPIDLGNLRSSFFVVTANQTPNPGGNFKGPKAAQLKTDTMAAKMQAKQIAASTNMPTVVFGFGANYAFWVHEKVGVKFSRPGSGAKFLEAALKRNKKAMLQSVAESTKIK